MLSLFIFHTPSIVYGRVCIHLLIGLHWGPQLILVDVFLCHVLLKWRLGCGRLCFEGTTGIAKLTVLSIRVNYYSKITTLSSSITGSIMMRET